MIEARGEAGAIKSGPEPVSRACEMMIYCCGVEARVYSAEKDFETGSDYITDRFVSGFKQLLSVRSGFHDEFSFKGALFR